MFTNCETVFWCWSIAGPKATEKYSVINRRQKWKNAKAEKAVTFFCNLFTGSRWAGSQQSCKISACQPNQAVDDWLIAFLIHLPQSKKNVWESGRRKKRDEIHRLKDWNYLKTVKDRWRRKAQLKKEEFLQHSRNSSQSQSLQKNGLKRWLEACNECRQ